MVACNSIVQNVCDEVLHCIRTSNLHFSLQETPFSLYVTLRKKLVSDDIDHIKVLSEKKKLQTELAATKNMCESLENEKKVFEGVTHDLGKKMEKATVDIQEALTKNKKKLTEKMSKTKSL